MWLSRARKEYGKGPSIAFTHDIVLIDLVTATILHTVTRTSSRGKPRRAKKGLLPGNKSTRPFLISIDPSQFRFPLIFERIRVAKDQPAFTNTLALWRHPEHPVLKTASYVQSILPPQPVTRESSPMSDLINARFYQEPWLTAVLSDHSQTQRLNMKDDRMAQTCNGQVFIA